MNMFLDFYTFPCKKCQLSGWISSGSQGVWVLCLGMVLLSLNLPSISFGQTTAEQASELRQKIAQLQAIRRQRIDLKRQVHDLQSSKQKVTDRLTKQVAEKQKQTLAIELQNNHHRQQLTDIKQQMASDMNWLTQVSQHALKASALIQKPLTIKPETAALLQEAIEQLNDQSQRELNESHKSFAGITNLTQWLQSQRQQAQRVQLSNQTIALADDRVIHAYVLEVGTIGEYFASEDFSEVGYRSAKGWQTNLSEPQQKRIAQSIAMLRGKLPPALIALPFELEKAGE